MIFFALKTVLVLLPLFTSQVDADACETTTQPNDLDTNSLVAFTDLRVTCSPATVTVKLDHCAVQCLGHDSTEELTITDPGADQVNASQVLVECRPELVGNDTVFVINISDCSPSITNNMSHAIYTYAVRSYADEYISGAISRGTDIGFIFSCVYNLNVRTSLALGGAQSSSSLSYAPVSYDLAVAMAIFNSSTFSFPVTGTLEVAVPDYIYVGLTFTDGDANYLVLQAVNCWATPTSSSTDARQYVILENGCPIDVNVYTVLVYENYESSQAKFSFKAFTWSYLDPSQQSIYVHCEVEVCDSVLNDTCIVKGCVNMGMNKRKRSILSPDSIVVSVGPLKIATSRSVCGKSNGGCDHVCKPGNHGDVTCSCVPGYQLLDDGKTCEVVSFPDGHFLSANVEKTLSSADLLVLIAIALILLISAILIVVIVRKTMRNKSRDDHQFQQGQI